MGATVAIAGGSVVTLLDDDTTAVASHFHDGDGGFHIVQAPAPGRVLHLYVDTTAPAPVAPETSDAFTFDSAFTFPVTVFGDLDVQDTTGTVGRLSDYGLRWQSGNFAVASAMFSRQLTPPLSRATAARRHRDGADLSVVEVTRSERDVTVRQFVVGSADVDAVRIYTFVDATAAVQLHRLVDSDYFSPDNDTVNTLANGVVFTSGVDGAQASGYPVVPAPRVFVGARGGATSVWDLGQVNFIGSTSSVGDVASVFFWDLPAGQHRLDQLVAHLIAPAGSNTVDEVALQLQTLNNIGFRVVGVWDRGPG